MNSPFAMVKAVVMVALVAGARGSTSTSVAAAQPSKRSQGVRSFKVMDVVAAAAGLEAAGRKVFHLEVGQPVTGAPREEPTSAPPRQRCELQCVMERWSVSLGSYGRMAWRTFRGQRSGSNTKHEGAGS